MRQFQRPTGRQLFRSTVVISLAALVFGGLALYACWRATGFDPSIGREFRRHAVILCAACGVMLVTQYPWTPLWAKANGCRPDDPPPTP